VRGARGRGRGGPAGARRHHDEKAYSLGTFLAVIVRTQHSGVQLRVYNDIVGRSPMLHLVQMAMSFLYRQKEDGFDVVNSICQTNVGDHHLYTW
jgi:hypothetical protein